MKKYLIGVALFFSSSLFAGNCACQFVDGGVYDTNSCPCVVCLPDATIIQEPVPCPKPVVVCPTVVKVKCTTYVVAKPKPACDCCYR